MRASWFFVVGVGVAVACGGSDEVDVDEARSADLFGWWVHHAEVAGQVASSVTVHGFVAKEEAEAVLGAPAGGEDVSAVYFGSSTSRLSLAQMASFAVEDGRLRQTTLFDAINGPGVSYETQLLGLVRGSSLTLESSQSAEGRRSYDYYPRCPIEQVHGFGEILGLECPSYFATATALAFDPRGALHLTVGNAGGGGGPCVALPVYGVFGPACEPVRYDAPAMTASALAVHGDEVFHAWLDGDWNVSVRRRRLDSNTWQVIELGQSASSIARMWLFADDAGQVLVLGGHAGGAEVRRSGEDFAPTPATGPEGPLTAPLLAASRAPGGRLGLLADALWLESSAGSGADFEAVALPHAPGLGWGGGLRLLADEVAHVGVVSGNIGSNPDGVGGMVLGGEGRFLVYDAGAWEVHELGLSSMVLVPAGASEAQVFVASAGKSAKPRLYVGRVVDGAVRAELLSLEPSFGLGGSPESFYHPTAAIGPEGQLAATFNGEPIAVRRFDDLPWRASASFGVEVEGARVVADDGRLDCPGACAIDVPLGTRLAVRVTADAGNQISGHDCSPRSGPEVRCWFDVDASKTVRIVASPL